MPDMDVIHKAMVEFQQKNPSLRAGRSCPNQNHWDENDTCAGCEFFDTKDGRIVLVPDATYSAYGFIECFIKEAQQ
jgi:hypothetical protein